MFVAWIFFPIFEMQRHTQRKISLLLPSFPMVTVGVQLGSKDTVQVSHIDGSHSAAIFTDAQGLQEWEVRRWNQGPRCGEAATLTARLNVYSLQILKAEKAPKALLFLSRFKCQTLQNQSPPSKDLTPNRGPGQQWDSQSPQRAGQAVAPALAVEQMPYTGSDGWRP